MPVTVGHDPLRAFATAVQAKTGITLPDDTIADLTRLARAAALEHALLC